MNSLPNGWAETDFGKIYELNYGKALPEQSRDGTGIFPVYGSSGVVGYHSSFLTEGPVLIVGRKGAAGAVSYSRENCWPIDTTYFVRAPIGIDLQFAFSHLQALHLDHLEKSTAIPGLSRDDAYALRIWVPPTEEQSRIVAKIEELFSELDKAVESLTAAQQQLAAYRQSLLKHAFEGTLNDSLAPGVLPAKLVRLGEVIEYLTSGSRGWADYYSDAGEIFIRAQNLKHDQLDLGDIAFVRLPQGLTEGIRTRIRRGDVLITITGANVTKTGLVDKDLGTAYISQHVALCRTSASLLPAYLYWYLLSESGGRKQLTKAAYGAGKPGLNLDNIRNIVIPLPSVEQQASIASWIAEGIDAERNIAKTVAEQLSRISALRFSIFRQAFSGRLVAQDSNDGPASVLLERIRTEREANAVKPKKATKPKGEAA